MDSAEVVFFWVTEGLYLTASLVFLSGVAFRREKWLRGAVIIALIGLLAHTATIAARWTATGHPPVRGDYENTLAGAWPIVGVFLFLQWRRPNLKILGTVVMPFAVIMLGYGVMRSPQLAPLPPAFQSYWLWVHIAFAWMAYSAYVVAGGLAGLFLWRERSPAKTDAGQDAPPAPVLDDLSYRLITCGFIADSAMMVAGAIWANSLWGSYWSWDPIQVWALISWLIYGVYIHLRATLGWRRQRAAWLAVGNLATVIISFFGVNLLAAGLHVF